MQHKLKCWPDYFNAIVSGNKKFEVRKNDRNYQLGDILMLAEWNPDFETYTGKTMGVTVTHIMYAGESGAEQGIKEGWCVMSIKTGWND